mgnify:FL=1|jgi:hypothetical protein
MYNTPHIIDIHIMGLGDLFCLDVNSYQTHSFNLQL